MRWQPTARSWTASSRSPTRSARLQFSMGPITVDFDGFIGMRLSEHTLHTWDVEVALDPHATLDDAATDSSSTAWR